MKTTIQKVTPEKAAEIIEKHDAAVTAGELRQRKVNERLVDQFAADMKAGNWRLTHQGMAFDTNGQLIDGQHRLRAVIQAGVPVEMIVTTGLEPESMDVLDSGMARPLGQQLHIVYGYLNANEQAAIAKAVAAFVVGDSWIGARISINQIKAIYEQTGFKRHVEDVFTVFNDKPSRKTAMITPWLFYREMAPAKARAFALRYRTLEDCPHGDPALVLNRYLSTVSNRARVSRIYQMNVSANCYKADIEGRKILHLQSSREARHWLLEGNAKVVKHIRHALGVNGGAEQQQNNK